MKLLVSQGGLSIMLICGKLKILARPRRVAIDPIFAYYELKFKWQTLHDKAQVHLETFSLLNCTQKGTKG